MDRLGDHHQILFFLRRDNGTELFGGRVDVAFMAGGEPAGAARR